MARGAEWIEVARSLTVRELRDRVRETRETETRLPENKVQGGFPEESRGTGTAFPNSEEYDDPGWRVSFHAPPAASLLGERGVETARRILGWQAPVAHCVEALLAESAPEAGGDELEDEACSTVET